MRVAGLQLQVPPVRNAEEKTRHLKRAAAFIESEYEKQGGFDLLLLPELSAIDYSEESFKRLDELAEPLRGESFAIYSKTANKLQCAVSYGFVLKENNAYYIAQSVVSPDGSLLAHYKKMHIAQFGASTEKDYFQRGNESVTFDYNGWTFGLMICYDIRFPELARTLCLNKGADCILHPVAFTRDETFFSWHPFVITRALENQVYLLSLNRAGSDYGSSIFCPPWTDDKQPPALYGIEESVQVFTLQKHMLKNVRNVYSFRKDRLLE